MNYTYRYLSLASNISIPTLGYLELMNLQGRSRDGFTTVDLALKVANVRSPAGVPRVKEDYFYVRRVAADSATVALKRSIIGPQDVELHLNMSLYNRGVHFGFNIVELFIYISPYDF